MTKENVDIWKNFCYNYVQGKQRSFKYLLKLMLN